MNFKTIEDQYALKLFGKRGIELVRGQGASLWDDEGREYIDCMAGHGVVNIGHANPAVVKALTAQAEKLLTCTGSFYHQERALLMQKLVEITPDGLDQVFLCNSGTESIEAALKFARLSTGKQEIICAMRSFHGRTFGALSATFNPAYRKGVEPLLPGFSFVPYNNIEKLSATVNANTAAIMLEVVQGEGGVHPGTQAYFSAVQELCRQQGILLIIDEVQTGFCRTGKMFACEHFDIQPDMICLAKAMAGGMPIGAVVCNDKIKVASGKHGTTFGGNPLACAAANASIRFMQENDLTGEAERKGCYFEDNFPAEQLGKVRELRRMGLMLGIELKEKAQESVSRLQDRGILTMTAGATVLRLLPPLVISEGQLDTVINEISTVLSA